MGAAALVVVIGVGVIAYVVGASDDNDGQASRSATKPVQETYGVGETARTGDFEVTLHTVEDPFIASNPFEQPPAAQHFVATELTIRNTTDEQLTMSTLLGAEVHDGQNRAWGIAIAATERPQLEGTVAAGESRRGWMAFAVADDATDLRLRLKGNLTATGTVFALAQGKPAAAPDQSVIYEDDFSDPASGWSRTLTVADPGWAYDQGGYRLYIADAPKVEISDSHLEGDAYRADLVALGDVSVEATVTPDDNPTGSYGLACRAGGVTQQYAAFVDAGGAWRILRFQDGQVSTLVEATESPRRRSPRQRLRLDCTGDHVREPVRVALFVDGRRLGEAEDPAGLPPGTFAFLGQTSTGPMRVVFDDLVVRRP